MSKHTPTPWHIACGRSLTGIGRPAHYVAPTAASAAGIKLATPWVEGAWDDDAEARANAAFIVRAVNNHDALVEALEEMPGRFEDASNNPCTCNIDENACRHCNAWQRVVNDLNLVLDNARLTNSEGGGE